MIKVSTTNDNIFQLELKVFLIIYWYFKHILYKYIIIL